MRAARRKVKIPSAREAGKYFEYRGFERRILTSLFGSGGEVSVCFACARRTAENLNYFMRVS